MQIKIVAKAVIQNQAGEVLLLRRSPTDSRRPGEWDFPGGGIEIGEDIVAGVSREIAEEAGLTMEVADLTLVFGKTETYQEDDGESVTRLLFLGQAASSKIMLSDEHDGYKWVDVETALKEFPHPFYGAGLQYAAERRLLAD